MPADSEGRPVRCRVCGRVHHGRPRTAPPPLPPSTSNPSQAASTSAETNPLPESSDATESRDPHGWLDEFSRQDTPVSDERLELYDLAEPEEPEPPFPVPEVVIEYEDDPELEEDDDVDSIDEWHNAAERPFWRDLMASFTFVFDSGNILSLAVIVVINIWCVFLGYVWVFGWLGQLVLNSYLAAFYLLVIRDTAAGEDDLPNVWISCLFEDLIIPWIHFVASGLLIFIPPLLLIIGCVMARARIPWELVGLLAAAGVFFWPVIILGLAIGGGFHGLWPHTVLKTVLAAPVAYLAIWFVLLIAGAVSVVASFSDLFAALPGNLLPAQTFSTAWILLAVSATISAYCSIVAMRSIGLYYRHFKRQLPWIAE